MAKKTTTKSAKTLKAKETNEAVPTKQASGLDKLNAGQKINFILTQLKRYEDIVKLLSQENMALKTAIEALDKRVLAIIKSGDEGSINSNNVKDYLVKQAERELKAQVDYFVKEGSIIPADEQEIGNMSLVVGRELNTENEVVNPRIQLLVNDLEESQKSELIGKKVGALLVNVFNEGFSLEVTEHYTVAQKDQSKE